MGDSDSLKVIIVDDHPLFREGLKAVLAGEKGHEFAGEAGTALDALELAEEVRPDVAVVDIVLPDKDGHALTRELLATLPDLKVLIVSTVNTLDSIVNSYQAGANGYIIKNSAAQMLVRGLSAIITDNFFLDENLDIQIQKKFHETKDRPSSPAVVLTSREKEVLQLLAQGVPSRVIGEKLFISPKTAENHRTNIMKKLGLKTNVELIKCAARMGYIDLKN